MRYFTRGWTRGELSDADYERVVEEYRARLAEISPRLPPTMLRLTRDVSLHDGLIEHIKWSPTKRRLELSLVCGNVQTGYFLVQLAYDGTMLGSSRVDSLRRAAESRHTELLYDELDIDDDDGHLVHRLLFQPCEEVTIDFEQFDMTISPRPDDRVGLLRPFFEERPEGEDAQDEAQSG